jgi:hypothetical protein
VAGIQARTAYYTLIDINLNKVMVALPFGYIRFVNGTYPDAAVAPHAFFDVVRYQFPHNIPLNVNLVVTPIRHGVRAPRENYVCLYRAAVLINFYYFGTFGQEA